MTIYPNSVVCCLFFDIKNLKGLVFQSFHKIYAASRSLAAAPPPSSSCRGLRCRNSWLASTRGGERKAGMGK